LQHATSRFIGAPVLDDGVFRSRNSGSYDIAIDTEVDVAVSRKGRVVGDYSGILRFLLSLNIVDSEVRGQEKKSSDGLAYLSTVPRSHPMPHWKGMFVEFGLDGTFQLMQVLKLDVPQVGVAAGSSQTKLYGPGSWSDTCLFGWTAISWESASERAVSAATATSAELKNTMAVRLVSLFPGHGIDRLGVGRVLHNFKET
jgi:hypothetical protein